MLKSPDRKVGDIYEVIKLRFKEDAEDLLSSAPEVYPERSREWVKGATGDFFSQNPSAPRPATAGRRSGGHLPLQRGAGVQRENEEGTQRALARLKPLAFRREYI